MAGSTIWAPVGDKGPDGDKGPTGDPGPQGPVGPPGPGAEEFAAFVADLANSTDPAKGAGLVGFNRNVVGAVGRTVNAKLREQIWVGDFGAVGDGITDDLIAINAAISYTKTVNGTLNFDNKVYACNGEVKFGGADNVHFKGTQGTVIKGLGAGIVASIDNTVNIYNDNISIDGFVFQGNAATTYCFYTRGHVRGKAHNLRAYDATLALFRFDFSVLVDYENIFYSNQMNPITVVPAKGMIIEAAGGLRSTANLFKNLVVEATITAQGLDILNGDLNLFCGGAVESVPSGTRISSTSNRNHFLNFDWEGNTNYDIDDSGKGTIYSNCSASSTVSFNVILEPASCSTQFYGGYIASIILNSTQLGPVNFFGTQFKNTAGISASGVGPYQAFGCNRVDATLVPVAEQDFGEFTPSFEGATTPGTVTYTTRKGIYQRVGRIVTFHITLVITANTGGVGTCVLRGFPFKLKPLTGSFAAFLFTTNTGVTFAAGKNRLVCAIAENSAVGVLEESTDGKSSAGLPIGSIGSGSFYLSGSYISER